MDQINEADALLQQMVAAYNRQPNGRFILARALSGRNSHRISHPGGSISVDEAVVEQLIARRFITVQPHETGFKILVITLRGFDYESRLSRGDV